MGRYGFAIAFHRGKGGPKFLGEIFAQFRSFIRVAQHF